MSIQAYIPDSNYQHFIKEYWNLTAEQPGEAKPFSILPDGSVEIIFNYGDTYTVSIGQNTYTIEKGVYLRGVCLNPIVLQMGKKIAIWGLRVNPVWIQTYLNHYLKESYESIINLHHFHLPQNIETMTEDEFITYITASIDWQKKAIVDTRILQGIEMMESYKGNVKMEELASACFLSLSAFERKFKKQMGLSPKAYCQLIRFKSIVNQLLSQKIIEQTEIIHEHNLTDHSHLNKITKDFSNETPTSLKSKISRFFTKTYLAD